MTKSFGITLKDHSLVLKRARTTTAQINVGLACNLTCKHCHLDCSPGRKEVMQRRTMDDVVRFVQRNSFEVIDITGGAPELVPGLAIFLEELRPLAEKLLLRTNLTLLLKEEYRNLLDTAVKNRVTLVASLPSVNENQTNAQRGNGVWQKSIDNLKKLNQRGYGLPQSELELILVSNPAGAFMPMEQCIAESKFRRDLASKWGLHFTNLFTFANVPLGRFKTWLENSGNYEGYLGKLSGAFNPVTIENLMCRTLVSISWDGYLYDCDFNQAAGLPMFSKTTHIAETKTLSEYQPIVTDNHCYACTAGAGFT